MIIKILCLFSLGLWIFAVLDCSFGGDPRNYQGPYEDQ
jgi:hypothetical protein